MFFSWQKAGAWKENLNYASKFQGFVHGTLSNVSFLKESHMVKSKVKA